LYLLIVCYVLNAADLQVLLRGLTTLITMNIFLASAVFIGLSLTSPDDVNNTLQHAYYDLAHQLAKIEHHLQNNTAAAVLQGHNTTPTAPTSNDTLLPLQPKPPVKQYPWRPPPPPPIAAVERGPGRKLKSQRTLADEDSTITAGSGAASFSSTATSSNMSSSINNDTSSDKGSPRSPAAVENLKESPSEFFPAGKFGECRGDEGARPRLMAQQILAFMLFLGSSGVAFGLLLSVQPEGELDEPRERVLTWAPYILWCGFSTLAGILFLLWSLITMAEVQYGHWLNWGKCGLDWLGAAPGQNGTGPSATAVAFIVYEITALMLGLLVFFSGWTIL
jgi:hypothetical protein